MILERVKQFIDFKGISIAAFERSIGMANASFGKSLKNKGAIGSDKLEKILSTYPEISPTWLMTGNGSMLKTKGTPSRQEAPLEAIPATKGTKNIQDHGKKEEKDNHLINKLLDRIAQQAEEIGRLKSRIEELERHRGETASDAPASAIAHAG